MKHYDYVYVVCFWGTDPQCQNRKTNLTNHMKFLARYPFLKDKSCLMIIGQRGINPDLSAWITEETTKCLTSNISFQLLTGPNWGMLVGTLWDAWKYLEKEQITAQYVLAMEDDWFYNHWGMRSTILDKEPIIYLGMFSSIGFSNPESEAQYRRWVKQGFKEVCNSTTLRWTDGGCYMLKFSSLKRIENVIGCFTKAPKVEIVDRNGYGEHGIQYGEVGFPTELHSKGFKFRAFTDVAYEGHFGYWWDPSSKAGGYPDEFLLDDMNCFKKTWIRKTDPFIPDPPRPQTLPSLEVVPVIQVVVKANPVKKTIELTKTEQADPIPSVKPSTCNCRYRRFCRCVKG